MYVLTHDNWKTHHNNYNNVTIEQFIEIYKNVCTLQTKQSVVWLSRVVGNK